MYVSQLAPFGFTMDVLVLNSLLTPEDIKNCETWLTLFKAHDFPSRLLAGLEIEGPFMLVTGLSCQR